jgi:hypothetical protein
MAGGERLKMVDRTATDLIIGLAYWPRPYDSTAAFHRPVRLYSVHFKISAADD